MSVPNPGFHFGGLYAGNINRVSSQSTKSTHLFRFYSNLEFGNNFEIVNTVILDQELIADPSYLGDNWRGFAGYTEQAFASFETKRFTAKFGRDFLRWGRGQDATLLVSDYSRPFDQFNLQLRVDKIQFSYFTSKLDAIKLTGHSENAGAFPYAERYMSGGRLDIALFDQSLQFAVNQAVLYARAGGFEWSYLNPFLVYHGESLNDLPRHSNSIISLDVSFFPRAGLELYGEVLIDDFQIESKTLDDLEPDEYGFLFGTRMADLFGTRGVTTGIEYSKVKNRTYNSPEFFEKFLHRNRPIGHFLGNDFDRWLLFARKYLGTAWRIHAQADFRRHGEGRIEAPWDTPWLASTLEEGYSEPFPTGIVEKTRRFGVELRWHPQPRWFVELTWHYTKFDNHLNVRDAELSETEIRLNIWLEWSKWMKI